MRMFFAYWLGGWFTWIAVGAAAVSAVGSIASSSMNKQTAPAAAAYTPVDPSQIESQTVNADISNMGSAQQLSSSTSAFNSSQALSALNTALPGYSGLASGLMGDAQSLAANPYAIPQSVVGQLSQYAAENNIAGGTGATSGFSNSNMLRSLGVNALQYGQTNIQTAMGALSTLTGTAPNVAPTSPLSFMLSPSSVLQTQTNNNTMAQNIQQGSNNANAAASNANSNNLWDSITSQITPLVNAAKTAASGGNVGGTTMPTVDTTNPNQGYGYTPGGTTQSDFINACWVAREVFGNSNPKWMKFRNWMLNIGPRWFRWLYLRYGECFAEWLHEHPFLKPTIRAWMESRIA